VVEFQPLCEFSIHRVASSVRAHGPPS
jgi:hypothetical protein